MKYLAITQGLAEWLLPKIGLMDALHSALIDLADSKSGIIEFDFIDGPIRMAMDETEQVITLWHVDYILGAGDEPWGFIKITGELSIEREPQISREVLERSIYVINQRLQCLMIDGAYFYRRYPNDAHTLLAGRGTAARHHSIGYFEKLSDGANSGVRTIICIGPHESFSILSSGVEKEGKLLTKLSAAANRTVTEIRSKKQASEHFLSNFRKALSAFISGNEGGSAFENVQIITATKAVSSADAAKTIGMNFDEWNSHLSPLSDTQRRILNSDSLDRHPLRILGPAGSGKTLLMQLLAIRKLQAHEESEHPIKILYIVHSEAMRAKVNQKFEMLSSGSISSTGVIGNSAVNVVTLSEYCRVELQLDLASIVDPDASDAKDFQLEQVRSALLLQKEKLNGVIEKSLLFKEIFSNADFLRIFEKLTLAEISVSIKGHGLENDKKRYVESERSLSRFHGILSKEERDFIFETFREYHQVVFEQFGVLDPDDIALSLAGRLRTPVWQLRRRSEGYDYIFVDEAQLFNENERRILPLLTKGITTHVPIALALDEAQALYGQPGAGLATLGIHDITNESLESVYRCTSAIVKLAFFIIQRSTNLFGPDFPDFAKIDGHLVADNHPLAALPRIEFQNSEQQDFSKFVLKRVRDLRKANNRQIVVVCHADKYWDELESSLSKTDLPFQVLRERGAKIRQDEPIVVLCRPAQVGGQEFDAAMIIGLEMGLVPPNIIDNEALATAIEQQAIRESYLSVTRAKYSVTFAMSAGATPNKLLQQARQAGLLS
ncbi:UvrD-helicase domain-containing protein [Massilia sp. YIM B04103]|uniref:UvrD-helicase domain-containing protein n=1 Tax=Massilia sp. YIM B04103 TaxID=2963106 RepID=UPI0021093A02|nr:UvrD-helicase domain-containing protein [Massilia sp. YIM B04103]